jgi:hypothetical protein
MTYLSEIADAVVCLTMNKAEQVPRRKGHTHMHLRVDARGKC